MQTFDFDFDPRFALFVRATTGATPGNSSVTIDEDQLLVRFGRLGVKTPLSNVKDVRITRGYQWFKAIGARLSFSDRGATYGTTTTGGVCICFHEPLRALPVADSPGLTLTVADLDGLAAAVRTVADVPDVTNA